MDFEKNNNIHTKLSLFSIKPLISSAIIIAIVFAAYYYIDANYLFLDWITTIYYVAKIIIAFEIIRASAHTLLAPILTLVIGLLILFTNQVYGFDVLSDIHAWQLVMMSGVGFVFTILVKFIF